MESMTEKIGKKLQKRTYTEDIGLKTEEKKDEVNEMPEYEERPSTARFFAESSIPIINEQKLADRSAAVQQAYVKFYENQKIDLQS